MNTSGHPESSRACDACAPFTARMFVAHAALHKKDNTAATVAHIARRVAIGRCTVGSGMPVIRYHGRRSL